MLVKKEHVHKILLRANIRARKAALIRNYFFRRNNFSQQPSVPLSSLQKGELPILSNFHLFYRISVPCLDINGSEWGFKMQSGIY